MNTVKKQNNKIAIIQGGNVSKKTILSLTKSPKKESIEKRYHHDQILDQKVKALTEQVGGLMKTLSIYKKIENQSIHQDEMISSQQKQISNLELRLIEFSKEMYSHKSLTDHKLLTINTQVKENTFKTSFAGLWETMSQMIFGK